MASTAKAGNVVGQIRTMCTDLIDFHGKLQKVVKRYNANGGQTFLHPFFLKEDGITPRTDLDVTEAQIVTAIANMQTVFTRVDNFLDTFVQAE
jgi:hypothetical protein